MADTLILQDISPDGIEVDNTKYEVFHQGQTVKPCVGCYGCWLKTPGKCVIKDSDSDFAVKLAHAREVVVISRLVFGGLSPDIKAIFDRSIGFVLPFFCVKNGEMHHERRYSRSPSFKYMFYSDTIVEAEKATAEQLVKANAVNLWVDNYTVSFHTSTQGILEELS